ncbi:MAG TPA: hypothetical protein PKI03_24730 [Pseudomonadota bacterium]|nr:hypothetical protein [Pseudomonadota bacterium]
MSTPPLSMPADPAVSGSGCVAQPSPARHPGVEAYVAALRGKHAARLPVGLPHVVIQMQTDLLRLLPPSRRLLHRAHLHTLVEGGWEDALSDGPPPAYVDPESPGLQALSAATCRACGGKCCRHGGTQAYINHDSLRQFRALRPHDSPEDFVATYADRLAAQTYEGSCVQHGSGGCTLPRALRSETCNRHLCDGLLRIHGLRVVAGRDFQCLLVRLSDGQIHSAGLLSEQGFELLDQSPGEL